MKKAAFVKREGFNKVQKHTAFLFTANRSYEKKCIDCFYFNNPAFSPVLQVTGNSIYYHHTAKRWVERPH
jgi:hypothetical protein